MHYTGAGIISTQAFKYGFYEARFKVPPGAGWHSSFWMMFHNGKGGTSPAAAYQELDVIENDSIHKQSYEVNVHNWKGEHVSFGGKSVKTPDISADFHVYGCEFTPQTVKYFFDGALVQTVDVATPRKMDGKPFAVEHGDQHIWLTSIASKSGNTGVILDSRLWAAIRRILPNSPELNGYPIASPCESSPRASMSAGVRADFRNLLSAVQKSTILPQGRQGNKCRFGSAAGR